MTQAHIYLLTVATFIAAMMLARVAARRLTGRARELALRRGVLSHVTERSSHEQPTPRLGGLGLALGFALASVLFLVALWQLPHVGGAIGFNPALILWLALGWAGMLVTGLLDDLYDLRPLLKLGLMLLASLAVPLGAGIRPPLAASPLLPSILQEALSVAAVVLWILFFTNAFNFMDGMDGLAARFAQGAALFMFAVVFGDGLIHGLMNFVRAEAYLLPILAMACWGFLHWNSPPARIFMGDGGSLSIGYLLAVFPLLGASGRLGLRLSFLSALIILLPFLFDVTLTLVRRARRGENLLKAHREHLYQRLLQTGLSHAQVLTINRRLFYGCGAAALIGTLSFGRPGELAALAVALFLMTRYWRMTIDREKLVRR